MLIISLIQLHHIYEEILWQVIYVCLIKNSTDASSSLFSSSLSDCFYMTFRPKNLAWPCWNWRGLCVIPPATAAAFNEPEPDWNLGKINKMKLDLIKPEGIERNYSQTWPRLVWWSGRVWFGLGWELQLYHRLVIWSSWYYKDKSETFATWNGMEDQFEVKIMK